MTDRDEAGRFLPGNRIWEANPNPGRQPTFADGDELWTAAVEYFEWCHENPLLEDQLVTFQGIATHEPVAKVRALTQRGLCLFLGISMETWRGWRTPDHDLYRPDLADTIDRIEGVIWEQKFTHAAAGLLVHGLIARELGLADKQQHANDPDNPMPGAQVTVFALPDNGRG
ncbi:terminase small subunit [Salipiger marinus]|uniref:terminase small subunit n=1 Tax=Salipiger marinus TaxID=555512 RepID=UPI002CC57E91|nr:terminase small subunit [Salipiger manganoxidans]MEB3419916.1 terminase small subunit [Salipiger manganoxidans]